MRKLIVIAALLSLLFFAYVLWPTGLWFSVVFGQAVLPAFPGAQGGGAASVGGSGRNGTGTPQMFYVTNLQDSGGGSLRACVQASGPRTCIFRISGLISSLSRLAVTNPYLTIAGQTAPGGGIVLGGVNQHGEQLDVQTHDVIVRYLTYDGNSPSPTGPDTGTVGFEMANGSSTSTYNNIFDHLSSRWVGNKILIFQNDPSCNTTVHDNTWQWMLVYEPNISHPVGPLLSGYCPGLMVNNDLHHMMYINSGHRLPLLLSSTNVRIVNQITYNWDYYAIGQDGSANDYIGNLWIPGNLNVGDSNPHPINATLGVGSLPNGSQCVTNCLPGIPSIYMTNNTCGPGSGVANGTDFACTAEEAGTDPEGFPESATPIRISWRRNSPLSAEQFPIRPDATGSLSGLMTVSTGIGNSAHLDAHGVLQPNRDSQDIRVINQFLALGPGGEFNGPNYNGPSFGPAIPNATPCVTSQNDGICDQWKTDQGLSLTDATLWKRLAPNGYTFLENFLNGGSSNVTPPPPQNRPLAPTGVVATPH